MFIYFLKFFHLLFTLSLLGSAVSCLILVSSKTLVPAEQKLLIIRTLNKSMLLLAALALLSGTFLVYPKHFTFHTPWIQAAYTFTFIFFSSIFIIFKKFPRPRLAKLIYLLLIIILIAIIHDAVTKTTFLKLTSLFS